MSTIEDFENAPIGATATHSVTGVRAMKIDDVEPRWIRPGVIYLNDKDMVYWNYTLDPSAPTTAREALDLAWELGHEVKDGQFIPEGTRLLDRPSHSHFSAYMTRVDLTINEWESQTIRTLEPLPEPEPDWLDAPAVLARVEGWVSCADPQVFTRYDYEAAPSEWLYNGSEKPFRWQDLRDVTPLYPKEDA